MISASTDRPIPPDPQAYGLARDRIAKVSDPGFQDWWISGPVLWVGIVAALSSFAYSGSGTIAFYGFLAATLGPFLSLGIIELVWPRTQADFTSFEKFQSAEAEYHAKQAAWERTQQAWWLSLNPRAFERELARLLRSRGYSVHWTGRAGDGGVDIRIKHADGRHVVVQCKAHAKPVGPAAVRDLYGAMTHEGACEAWIVSTNGFTQAARDFTVGKPVLLRTITEILRDR